MNEERPEAEPAIDWVQRGARIFLGALVGFLVGLVALIQVAPASAAGRVLIPVMGVVLGAGFGLRFGIHTWRGLLDAIGRVGGH